jgi:hypothetical protein
MRNLIALFVCACALALAQQDGPATTSSEGPPPFGWQTVFVVNGSNQTTGICYARSALDSRRSRQISISSITQANPAVVTSTGHGLSTSSRPTVTISGVTGTGWSVANATFVATVIDANTFSIPIDSSAFGTLGGVITFTTTAPRSNIAEWAVQKIAYDGSGNAVWKGWIGGSAVTNQKCSDATSTTVQQQ